MYLFSFRSNSLENIHQPMDNRGTHPYHKFNSESLKTNEN